LLGISALANTFRLFGPGTKDTCKQAPKEAMQDPPGCILSTFGHRSG